MSGIQKQQQQQGAKAAGKAKKQEKKNAQQVNARQMLDAPETLRSEDVLAAQQQVGNQVVQRALSPGARDAAVTDDQGNLHSDIASKIQQKRGGGAPLPDAVRKDAHKALGKEFKNVRVHTDDTSDKLSRKISARAFTIGSDIFFKKDVYAPGTSKGRETLMHELTHVVQQSGSRSAEGKLKLGAPGTASEKEADRVGKKHSQAAAGLATSVSGTVQKQGALEDEELIQGQPEEEELQMQPDTGNVVQRVTGDDDDVFENGKLNYKKYAKSTLGGGKIGSGIKGKLDMFEEKSKPKLSKPVLDGKGSGKIAKGIQEQVENFGGSNKPKEKVDTTIPMDPKLVSSGKTSKNDDIDSTPMDPKLVEEDLEKKDPEKKKIEEKDTSGPTNLESENGNEGKSDSSNTKKDIQLPKDPPPDIPKKKPVLKRSKKGTRSLLKKEGDTKTDQTDSEKSSTWAKGEVKVDDEKSDVKIGQRGKNPPQKPLPEKKDEKTDKPKSRWQKFKGFAKKAGSKTLSFGKLAGMAAIGKVGSAVKKNLTEAKEQFFGKKKEEEKEEAPKASPVTINNYSGGGSGGGNGGGGGGMAETISDLFQENKRLKSQIAELEKEKEKV